MEDFDRFLNMTFSFLSYRGRSEKEVRDYLKKKKVPLEVIEKIISKCKEYRFINDKKFAEEWVSSRSTYRLKSKRVIKMELLQKGVDREVIEQALNQGTSQETHDNEQAKKLVEKRIERLRGLPRDEIYKKLAGFLGRRGFNWDTIKSAIDDVLKLGYNK